MRIQDRLWQRRARLMWMLLAATGAAGAGAVVGLTGAQNQASADLNPGSHQSMYTYGSSDCAVESRKDPINIVFVGVNGLSSDVRDHAARANHGGWDNHSGGMQYFIDHPGQNAVFCQPRDDQSASGSLDRYHMRYNQGDIDGSPDWDPTWRYYTLGAVHYEEFKSVEEWPDCFPTGHAVLGNDEDPGGLGGFNLGREQVWALWVTQARDHSVLADAQSDGDWGNIQRFKQCDDDYAWSDGEVLYIGMTCPDVDPTVGLCDPETSRVSVSSSGEEANDRSNWPVSAISADGRFVPFYSFADNLVPDDNNGEWDAFVHDRATGITERVSVSSSGEEADDWSYWHLAISADGRFVAFTSGASNLVTGDTNATQDVFVRDRQAGVTERVSVASDGTESNGSVNQFPAISADGRFVAFTSDADNLVAGITNDTDDVFVHDRQTGTTERVSVSSTGEEGNSYSGDWSQISISADGRFVAFVSHATNLVPDDNNDEYDVFVHDRQTGETERVSVDSAGVEANAFNWWPSISDDGRYVAFESNASNLVPGDTNICRPQQDPGNCADVFVHDRQTGTTERVSVSSTGEEATKWSEYPYISGSGRFVAFSSGANNLVSGDSNDATDIFVHDRETGLTQRVSVSSTGGQADGGNGATAINYDGTVVVFVSWATNLVADDTNVVADVFVRSSTTDSDGDGLPDSVDNCPDVANPGQENNDGDSLGDVCDNCPDAPNADQTDTNGDGEGDACDVDDDGDGYWDDDETAKGSDTLDDTSTPEHCDGVDNDGDTTIDEEPTGADWDIDGDTVKDCLDADVDTDGDGVVNTLDDDDDGDGFTDAREQYMSTDELGNCPTSSSHDAWPPDADHDQDADIGDVIQLLMGKIMNPALYDARSDADGDGDIDIGDQIILFFGKIMTRCVEFTFPNNTGGDVDDIHIEWSAAVTAVFSALDSELEGWSNRTLSGDGLTLDMDRPDGQGDMANGGQLTIVVQAPIAGVTVSACQWTLDGVDQGAC